MLKGLSCILVSILLSGCTTKDEKLLMSIYEKNKIYHQQLQKTEKIQLKENDITKVLLTATYIFNPKRKNADEIFIIGFYNEESQTQDFIKEGFSLLLNGKGAKSIKVLREDSPQLKDLSFVTEWSKFYLISFPHLSQKKLTLTVSSPKYGNGNVYFAKTAKYTLNKKSF